MATNLEENSEQKHFGEDGILKNFGKRKLFITEDEKINQNVIRKNAEFLSNARAMNALLLLAIGHTEEGGYVLITSENTDTVVMEKVLGQLLLSVQQVKQKKSEENEG